jgi:hypothetical protein
LQLRHLLGIQVWLRNRKQKLQQVETMELKRELVSRCTTIMRTLRFASQSIMLKLI